MNNPSKQNLRIHFRERSHSLLLLLKSNKPKSFRLAIVLFGQLHLSNVSILVEGLLEISFFKIVWKVCDVETSLVEVERFGHILLVLLCQLEGLDWLYMVLESLGLSLLLLLQHLFLALGLRGFKFVFLLLLCLLGLVY